MLTSSAKSKGRSLQCKVRDAFRYIGSKKGLEDDDVLSRGMGQNGVDVMFSPAASKVFGKISIEAKNHEKLNVVGVFWQHYNKYKETLVLLCHKRNRTEPLVTLRLSDFMAIYERSLDGWNEILK